MDNGSDWQGVSQGAAKTTTVRPTVVYGFLTVTLILITIASIAAARIQILNTRLNSLVKEQDVQIMLGHRMRHSVRERFMALQSMFITSDPLIRSNYEQQLREQAAHYFKVRQQLLGHTFSPQGQKLLQQQYQLTLQANKIQNKVLTLLSEDHHNEAWHLFRDRALPQQQHAVSLVDSFIALKTQQNRANLQQNRRDINRTYAQMLALSLFGILFSLGISYRISRRINAETEQHLSRELTLRHNELRERTIRENIPDGLLTLDEEGLILTCNQACQTLFGYSTQEMVGQSAELLLPPETRRRPHRKLNQQLIAARRKLRLLGSGHELTACRKDNIRFPVEIDVSRMELQGEISYIILIRDMTYKRAVELWFQRFNKELEDEVKQRTQELATTNKRLRSEIAEHLETQKQLTHLATHDALTKLPNRHFFNEQLSTALFHADRRKQQVALLFMDLDGFKQVNDTHGHKAGDLLLLVVAERIRNTVRREDLVARMGGDEFTVILAELSQVSDAEKVAQKIIESINRPIECEGTSCHVGISIGISYYPVNATHPDDLIRLADDAMYEAKSSGKNCYHSCHSSSQLRFHQP